jgi:hypothetical protein
MLVSSWGLEDGVTRGRQRKWVRGGFLADGGFLALFCWRGMVVVGWWVMLGLDGVGVPERWMELSGLRVICLG